MKETQTIKNLPVYLQALGPKSKNKNYRFSMGDVGNAIRGDTIWEEIDVEGVSQRSQ